MKKLAVVRGKGVEECPYGLDITQACKLIGDSILQMKALSLVDKSEIDTVRKNNKIIYLTQKINERCPFANEVMDKFNKVDCSWGDTAAGEGVHYLTPSPLYPRTFIGDGLEPGTPNKGQDVYDPRLYFDAPERDINVPFGLYSIFADIQNEKRLLKIASKYTNKNTNIREKIALLRNKYFDILKLIISNGAVAQLSNERLEKLLMIINDWAD